MELLAPKEVQEEMKLKEPKEMNYFETNLIFDGKQFSIKIPASMRNSIELKKGMLVKLNIIKKKPITVECVIVDENKKKEKNK